MALFRMTKINNFMNEYELNQGIGLPIVIIIIALALAGSGGSYYVIKRQAKQAREKQEKALRDVDAKLKEMRIMRGEMMRHKVLVVSLAMQNNSKESGEALIEDVGGKAKVTVKLSGAPRETSQPAHIHVGACPDPGAVKYPLTSVINGNSITQLEISVEELLKNLPLAVNVHKSAAEAKVYVACGDISGDKMMDKGDAMKSDDAIMEKDGGMMKKEGGMPVPGYEGMMTDKEVTHMVDLTAQNFSFSKSEIRVKKGEKIELTFEVKEGYHDWTLDGYNNIRTKKINTGGKETIEFTADKAGTFEYYCSVGSHRAMGMIGRLVVE